MNEFLLFCTAALQITLLDIVLSGDNVGVIALAIRSLNPKQAKLASLIGVSGAIGLRIFFASILTVIMNYQWLPLKLAGGILLLKITWDLINYDYNNDNSAIRSSSNFWNAVVSIIIADASMSIDNVLAIGGAADGHVGLITFGILLNIPIIFFGSQYIAALMRKHKIVIYIGAAILTHTALSMILEDNLLSGYIDHVLVIIVSWSVAALTFLYGFLRIRRANNISS